MPNKKRPSPCGTCTRVANKNNCGKTCEPWQAWFFAEWKKFNNFYDAYMKEVGNEEREKADICG